MSFQMTLEVKGTEIEVEVEAEGGHYAPASRRGHPDNWTPDESEDPEITAVYALRADGRRGKDILKALPRDTVSRLVRRAWDHFMAEPDYDPPDYDED